MGVACLAVGLDRAERTTFRPSGTDNELPNSLLWTPGASGRLRGEALVVVVVAVYDHVGVRPVEYPPDRPHHGLVAVLAGAEEGVVEVGQRAPRPVLAEVLPEPVRLAGTGAAAPHLRAVAVEGD